MAFNVSTLDGTVSGAVVSDQVNFSPTGVSRSICLRNFNHPWWRRMQLPITVPSNVLNAANNVVVPWPFGNRESSCGYIGGPS